MTFEIDDDVKAVAEFMQQNIAAGRLVGVATAIGRLAPILWGRFSADDVQAVVLTDGATFSVQRRPGDATQ